jgi:periplasmic copper chaperone A
MKKIFLITLLVLSSSLHADASNLLVENAFARPALKQQRNSAVFMTINNQGGDSAIVRASSNAAKVVELHTHINDKGVMRMRKIDQIDLPAGQTVTLEPGGLHIMFIGLNKDMTIGDSVALSLELADGSKKTMAVPVQKGMMKSGMKVHDPSKMKHH